MYVLYIVYAKQTKGFQQFACEINLKLFRKKLPSNANVVKISRLY